MSISNYILVTGCNESMEYLGYHLCSKLVKNKSNYVIYLNKFRTYDDQLSENQNFEFAFCDMSINSLDFLDVYPINQIYHLASYFGTQDGSYAVLKHLSDYVKKKNSKLLVAVSPVNNNEPYMYIQNNTYWGTIKKVHNDHVDAQYIKNFMDLENIAVNVATIYDVYGYPGSMVDKIISQAKNGDDITIYGNGSQERSFCHIYDLVNNLIKYMDSSYVSTMEFNETYSFNHLVRMIIKLTGSQSSILYKVTPIDDLLKYNNVHNKSSNLIKLVSYCTTHS